MYEYHASHALIPDEILEQIERYCNFSDKALPQSQECDNAIDIAIADTEPIDVYNIYAPLCSNSELTLQPKKTSVSYCARVFDNCDWLEFFLITLEKMQRTYSAKTN